VTGHANSMPIHSFAHSRMNILFVGESSPLLRPRRERPEYARRRHREIGPGAAWGGTYENETYDGALHGWMIAGGKVYHPEQAERGFAKLMAWLDSTLRSPVAA
jgi:dienelactone hydrolase